MALKDKLTALGHTVTGGRPMKNIGFALTDNVRKKPVYYFSDHFGRTWLADHPWALFRVRCDYSPAEIAEMIDLFSDEWK